MEQYLPWVGVALQWARSQPKFSEWFYAGTLVLGSAVLYVVFTPTLTAAAWRTEVIAWFNLMISVAGATQLTSTTANLVGGKLGSALQTKLGGTT